MHGLKLSCVACLALAACSSTGATTTHGTSSSSAGGSSAAGTGGSSTAGTGGSSTAGTGGSFVAGTPITAPNEAWTWVPFDDAFCADGSTTGLGVNLSSASTRVLIYLEGGGACWNAATCYTLMTAVNLKGYTAASFTADSTSTSGLAEPGGFFDRTAAANPFKDYSYVYMPYCTGDIFAGNNLANYGANTAHHVGFKNVAAYLERLVPTFPKADRVILAGSSAGGFGAAVNWWQTQQAFGKIRVDLIDDSGTPMPPDVVPMSSATVQAWFTSWNLAGTLPPGCTACTTQLDAILGYYNTLYPDHRAALLSYTQDTVLPVFYQISGPQFTTGLAEEITTYFTPPSTFKYFTNNAAGHVLINTPQLTTAGVTLQTFLTQMVTDDPAWADVHP